MVRLMVSALVEISRGKVSIDDLKSYLAEPKKDKLGAVSPPEGLFLGDIVFY